MSDWNKGKQWGERYPNMPAPPKSSPDFRTGVGSTKK